MSPDYLVNIPAHIDIVIVGCGPVGGLLALKLKAAGRSVLVLDKRESDLTNVAESRSMVLSWPTLQSLVNAGVSLAACMSVNVVNTVHASREDGMGRTVLSGEDINLPHLGAVVDYHYLINAVRQALQEAEVPVLSGASVSQVTSQTAYASVAGELNGFSFMLTSRLVVIAEGGQLGGQLSDIHYTVHDYKQSAILGEATFSQPAGDIAYERFSRQSTLAMLPYEGHYKFICSCDNDEAASLCASPDQLHQKLARMSDCMMGELLLVDAPCVYPLILHHSNKVSQGRTVLVGNAAQTVHPIAAQGLNLGIRDVLVLAALLSHHTEKIPDMLSRYERIRRRDRRIVIDLTHALIKAFQCQGLGAVCGMGMNLLDAVPPLRQGITEKLVFGTGVRYGAF